MISTAPRISAILLILASMATAADPPGIRAALVPAGKRQSAADFALPDASGKTANLRDYRGKVVVLDFWATWCTGCKEEIPWFSEFQKKYGAKGFAMVGVSLDDGGWRVLKPFLEAHNVPYRILLGNDRIAQRYRIQSMPDTFLIDRSGRVAAAYTAGLVDKDDVEANIKAVLDRR